MCLNLLRSCALRSLIGNLCVCFYSTLKQWLLEYKFPYIIQPGNTICQDNKNYVPKPLERVILKHSVWSLYMFFSVNKSYETVILIHGDSSPKMQILPSFTHLIIPNFYAFFLFCERQNNTQKVWCFGPNWL